MIKHAVHNFPVKLIVPKSRFLSRRVGKLHRVVVHAFPGAVKENVPSAVEQRHETASTGCRRQVSCRGRRGQCCPGLTGVRTRCRDCRNRAVTICRSVESARNAYRSSASLRITSRFKLRGAGIPFLKNSARARNRIQPTMILGAVSSVEVATINASMISRAEGSWKINGSGISLYSAAQSRERARARHRKKDRQHTQLYEPVKRRRCKAGASLGSH